MDLLAGKIAVVTGGAAGIGGAICRKFASEGAKVVVADIDAALAKSMAEEISGLGVAVDVRDEEAVKAVFSGCENAFGRLNILVNNAGIVPLQANIWEIDLAGWQDVLDINLRGAFLCTKYAMPLLKVHGGSILNMSSRMGLHGAPMQSHYSASKFALRGLTESVAKEAGPFGIRVNSICPGTVETQRFRERIAGRAKEAGITEAELIARSFTDPAALRRVVQPEEIAATALFLVSDAAAAITGEHIRIDAGR
ncbi:MAG: SDR family oxidoreductase [Rhodospirillaceae bacterium]|nr:SDR family oxidoreductase [Rhodospirillaceae bacterium]